MSFKTNYNFKNETLAFQNGTVHANGEKLYCTRCRFPFRKEHIKGYDADGNIELHHDADGNVYCPICAEEEGISKPTGIMTPNAGYVIQKEGNSLILALYNPKTNEYIEIGTVVSDIAGTELINALRHEHAGETNVKTLYNFERP